MYFANRISAASGEKVPAVYCTNFVLQSSTGGYFDININIFFQGKNQPMKEESLQVTFGLQCSSNKKKHFIWIPPKRKLLKNCFDWWSRSFSQTECRFVFEFVGSTRFVSGSKLWVYPPKGKFSVGVQFIYLKLISSLMEENVWFKNTE